MSSMIHFAHSPTMDYRADRDENGSDQGGLGLDEKLEAR
jgi:hypothetical protein